MEIVAAVVIMVVVGVSEINQDVQLGFKLNLFFYIKSFFMKKRFTH